MILGLKEAELEGEHGKPDFAPVTWRLQGDFYDFLGEKMKKIR